MAHAATRNGVSQQTSGGKLSASDTLDAQPGPPSAVIAKARRRHAIVFPRLRSGDTGDTKYTDGTKRFWRGTSRVLPTRSLKEIKRCVFFC
jgi:hypothetical protein